MDQRLLSAFTSKFSGVPNIIADWAKDIGGLQDKRILDFGCGEGTAALGIATAHGPSLVVGVDINREHEQLAELANASGIRELPGNLVFEEIAPGQISAQDRFDLVYSWSVFEHIDQTIVGDIVAGLRDKLRDGGHLFVQIAPLYYSPEGAHLWALGYKRWEHLTKQLDHIHREIYDTLPKTDADGLWSVFATLNKITAPQLIREVTKGGFRLVREYTTMTAIVPDDDLTSCFARDALVTDQVVALFERA
jgi:SAM-dependent methyltransferase